MTPTTTSCAVCGRVKQETNHWFKAHSDGDVLAIVMTGSMVQSEPFHTLDICGETCTHTLLSRWMEKQRSPEP